MDRVLFGVILLFTGVSLFWQILNFPPFLSHSFVIERFFSAFVGTGLTCIVMLTGRNLFGNNRLGLLCGIIIATQPWFIQESRIFSPILYSTFFITICFYFSQNLNLPTLKKSIAFLLFIGLLIFSVVVWVKSGNVLSIQTSSELLKKLFSLFSFDTFFISNNSFWFGETTDVGIFLPEVALFLLLGLTQIGYIRKQGYIFLLWILTAAYFAIINPRYPEGRNFFLALPPIIFISILGIKKMLYLKKKIYGKIIIVSSILLYIYSYLYFLHVYIIHNSQKIFQFMDKIYGNF